MTIRIRPAGAGDIPWLLEQLVAFDKFAGYKRSLIEDRAHAEIALTEMVRDHVCMIADKSCDCTPGIETPGCVNDVTRAGFIAGYRTPHPFNPGIRMLTETFWWVAPEFRGGRAGLMLLEEFEAYGKRYCDWIVFTLEHHSPVRPECLIRRGFQMKEQSYLLEIN